MKITDELFQIFKSEFFIWIFFSSICIKKKSLWNFHYKIFIYKDIATFSQLSRITRSHFEGMTTGFAQDENLEISQFGVSYNFWTEKFLQNFFLPFNSETATYRHSVIISRTISCHYWRKNNRTELQKSNLLL